MTFTWVGSSGLKAPPPLITHPCIRSLCCTAIIYQWIQVFFHLGCGGGRKTKDARASVSGEADGTALLNGSCCGKPGMGGEIQTRYGGIFSKAGCLGNELPGWRGWTADSEICGAPARRETQTRALLRRTLHPLCVTPICWLWRQIIYEFNGKWLIELFDQLLVNWQATFFPP